MEKAQELAASIVHRYLTLARYQHRFGHLLRKHYSISGQQLAVLRYLMQGIPRTVSEISDFLYVRDATTSPLLERMERDGYVRRYRSSEDSRKVMAEPTEKGRQIVVEAPMGAIARMRAYLPELPLEELEGIDRALLVLSQIAVDPNPSAEGTRGSESGGSESGGSESELGRSQDQEYDKGDGE